MPLTCNYLAGKVSTVEGVQVADRIYWYPRMGVAMGISPVQSRI